MDRVHFLMETPEGHLVMCQPGFKDVVEARKQMRGLDVGTYHLATFSEVGIVVEPPPPSTKNLVTRGAVTSTRAPSNKKKKSKDTTDGKAKA